MRVVVIGSVNRDRTATVPRLPARGETVVAGAVAVGPGGKGANQAVAAALAGAETAMVGCVGDDDAGRWLLGVLHSAGVDTAGVRVVGGPTGEALIAVEEATGDNTIVVVPGANRHLALALDGWAPGPGDVVVAQLEACPELVAGALRRARAAGATTVLNAAPVTPDATDAALAADHLVVNETELRALAGGDDERHVAGLAGRTGGTVVATFGPGDVVVGTAGGVRRLPVPRAAAVDTTGAGDCFAGSLAARLAMGDDLDGALAYGVAAASLSVTRPGASASFPAAGEVVAALSSPVARTPPARPGRR